MVLLTRLKMQKNEVENTVEEEKEKLASAKSQIKHSLS